MSYRSILAETVSFVGYSGDSGEAYYARPMSDGKFPGVVVIHHMPGWDEWIIEVARKFAHHGYAAIAPHLYFRNGPGSPDDIGARVRAAGGVADDQAVGDVAGAVTFLRAQPNSSGKVGVIGFCSGGRHAYLCACTQPRARPAALGQVWLRVSASSVSEPTLAARYERRRLTTL
jgi:carboxymethylenebutenolidase